MTRSSFCPQGRLGWSLGRVDDSSRRSRTRSRRLVLTERRREARESRVGADSAFVDGIQTWHHGLMARWWAEFASGGPEIDFFRRYVEAGQPALDLACGTGRLLVPFVEAGLDVDGVDVSADMGR